MGSTDALLGWLASPLRASLWKPQGAAVEVEAGAGQFTQMGLDQAR